MITIEQGSSLYYSLLWIKPDANERFVHRLNLIKSLNTTLDDVQEAQVAEQKIHWWHEELQRMCEGGARHPATTACQAEASALSGHATGYENHPFMAACLSLLSSVSNARFTPPKTLEDHHAQLIQNYTARLALLSHALSDNANDLNLQSHPAVAAIALAKHEQLIRLPTLLHRGHAIFSDDIYKAHNIGPSDLAAGVRVAPPTDEQATTKQASSVGGIPIVEDKPGKQSLLKAAIDDTLATFETSTTNNDVQARYKKEPLLPIWRLLVLRHKQLTLWQKKQPNLLVEHMTLTPIAKFFHAWRNRR